MIEPFPAGSRSEEINTGGATIHTRVYALPGNMHCAFEQFAAFHQDAKDNREFLKRGKLALPVLAIGGETSFGAAQAAEKRFAASDVTEQVIANSGHWLMEEQPAATIAAIKAFFDK
jgi:pimeloyl-ACP methyl ester carboxylesterase